MKFQKKREHFFYQQMENYSALLLKIKRTCKVWFSCSAISFLELNWCLLASFSQTLESCLSSNWQI